MNKQSLAIGFAAGLLIAVILLWSRVRELEKTVHALSQRPSATQSTVSLGHGEPENETENQNVFKLIDSPRQVDSDTSNVGVPWSVERAMMGGAKKGTFERSEGKMQWEPIQPIPQLVPDPSESK